MRRRLGRAHDRLRRNADKGSLFDLKQDTADDIARVMVNSVTDYKVEQIQKALSKARKAKKAKQAAPAG